MANHTKPKDKIWYGKRIKVFRVGARRALLADARIFSVLSALTDRSITV